jgi:hypothetical protein
MGMEVWLLTGIFVLYLAGSAHGHQITQAFTGHLTVPS